jgi:hypothetical protein
MKFTDKVIPGETTGQGYHIMSGKPTDNPNVSVYVLRDLGLKENFSLWNIEFSEGEESFHMWPYKGEDYEELTNELLKIYLEDVWMSL